MSKPVAGWTKTTIGEICDLSSGYGFKPDDWASEGLPIIRIQNLNGSQNFNYYQGEPKTEWLVEPGTILFAWAGTKGVSFGPTIWKGPLGVLNQHIYRVHPKENVDRAWLYLILEVITQRIEKHAHGFKATLVHVRKADITEQIVALPPLTEQRKIADILGTWDEAIALVERLIATLQLRKKGLMQRLLTGELRFKAFEGRRWDEVRLPEILLQEKNAIKVGPFGSQLRKSEMTDTGYKVYGQENVFSNDFNLGDKYIPEEKFRALQTCEIKPGDFLITMMGTIGKTSVVPDNIAQGIIDSHLMRLRINSNMYSKEFLAQLFQSSEVTKQVSRLSVGGIMSGLNSQIIQTLRLPLPPIGEQEKIAEVLALSDEGLNSLTAYKEGLATQKKGLMEHLLTGQIQVLVENKQI